MSRSQGTHVEEWAGFTDARLPDDVTTERTHDDE